tara:strand:- start:13081 stop:13701 length:621 start_codon:yes stop_codon:yes gene_type:complete
MEYYIYDIPLFIVNEPPSSVNLPAFCDEVEAYLPPQLLENVEVVYIGDFKELAGRNAAYIHGGIYMSATEPTNFDMLENFIHEVAHSLEVRYAMEIYDEDLLDEFKAKRHRLYHLLAAEGFHINPLLYSFTEYNKRFDEFLADTVGYPTLLTLTMGLFASPYGATSIQEYFANGFEKYFLDNPRKVRDISPVLYRKIENILNDNKA